MKFLILLIGLLPQFTFASPDISGVYKVEYIAPSTATDSYYKAQLILSKNGEALFRDQPDPKETMMAPGCVGSYNLESEQLTVLLDCSLVMGPKNIVHKWSFEKQSGVIQPSKSQKVIFQSNLFNNAKLEFSWIKIGDVVF